MKKAIFTVILFAFVAHAMLLAQQVTDVELSTLLSEIRNNEVRANQTYNGKTLRLTGTASGMSNEYLYLNAGYDSILVYFNSSERTKVLNLNRDQRITVRGVYAVGNLGISFIRNAVIETTPATTAQPTPTPSTTPTPQQSQSPSILDAISDFGWEINNFISGLFSPKPTPAPTPAATAQPSPAPINNSDLAKAHSERGLAFYNQSNWDSAITEYTEAIRLTPNDAVLYVNRGSAYYQKGDYDRAIADCTEAILLNSNNARAYDFRGASYYYKGNYDAAITDYTLAIRLDPNNENYYNWHGNAYYGKGDYDRAIADYTEAIRLNSNNANPYRNRANAYMQKGNYTQARTDVNRALQINANYQSAKDLDAELKQRGY